MISIYTDGASSMIGERNEVVFRLIGDRGMYWINGLIDGLIGLMYQINWRQRNVYYSLCFTS